MIDLSKFKQEKRFQFDKLSTQEKSVRIHEMINNGESLIWLYSNINLTSEEINKAIKNGEDLGALYEKYKTAG